MIETWLTSSLTLVALPILGALLGLALWKRPSLFRIWALTCLAATGVVLTMSSVPSSGDPIMSGILMALIVLTAFLTLLGQNPQKDTSAVLFLTLILVGLGLGFMTSEGGTRTSYLGEIFVLVSLTLLYYGIPSREMCWGALGLYGLALTCLAVSVVASGPMVGIMLVVALAIAFPLFPFHGAFISTLGSLPGSLPAFLVVLLPCLGFAGVAALFPNLPERLMHGILVLALVSALYGGLKALVQFRMGYLLTYAYLAQMAIVWWYIAVTGSATPQVGMYFSAVTLVTSGLSLAGHYLHTRYGHLDMDKLGGLAHSMPRFATILVLLITTAIGLPLFAVFSAFFEMMLHVSTVFPWSVLVILAVWLMMSWLYPLLMHRVLFGRPLIPALPHRDLSPGELLPLILMVLVLGLAGLVPSDLVGFTTSPILSFHVMEVGTWTP